MNIIIFGDSITLGEWDQEGGWVARIRKFTDQKVIATNFKTYISIYNAGISGDNTDTLLQRFENELKARFDPEDENLIIIAIGINDSQVFLKDGSNKIPLEKFKRNLVKILEICRANTPKIVFIGLTPVDEERVNPMPWKPTYGYVQKEVEKYNQTVKIFCEENKIEFINLLPVFLGRALLIDGVHPNTKGHELLAKIIYHFLKLKFLIEKKESI